MIKVTVSEANNVKSTDGNSLAVFVNAKNQELYLKDINGKIEPFYNYGFFFLPSFINFFDFSSLSTTIISQQNQWVKLNCVPTEGFSRNGLVLSDSTKVTYTSEITKLFRLQAIGSFSSGNNNELHMAFFKNGQLYPCSEESVVTSSGGKSSALPIQCIAELNQNDFVEIYVKNSTNATNINLKNINVIISEQ